MMVEFFFKFISKMPERSDVKQMLNMGKTPCAHFQAWWRVCHAVGLFFLQRLWEPCESAYDHDFFEIKGLLK